MLHSSCQIFNIKLNVLIYSHHQTRGSFKGNYDRLTFQVAACVWTKDLHEALLFTFIQLYHYLVIKTAKYDHLASKSTGYKKLKDFHFFVEGHIKSLKVTSKDGLTFLKAADLA